MSLEGKNAIVYGAAARRMVEQRAGVPT